MNNLAQIFFRYGADEGSFLVILAPDAVLRLFVDGSSIFESLQGMTLFESCWDETEVKELSYADLY